LAGSYNPCAFGNPKLIIFIFIKIWRPQKISDRRAINHSEQINPQKLRNYKQFNLFPYELKAKVAISTESSNYFLQPKRAIPGMSGVKTSRNANKSIKKQQFTNNAQTFFLPEKKSTNND